MFKRFVTYSVFSACLILAACGTSYKRSPVVTAQHLSCDGGIPAAITLYSPEDAMLSYNDQAYDLSRIETASGVKYGNDDIVFWNRGVTATIETGEGAEHTCSFVPKSGI